MRVLLLRHGPAEERGAGPDAERALTSRGLRRVRRVARALGSLGLAPTLILTSPLRRAEQTAAAAAEELAIPEQRTTAALAPGARPTDLLDELAGLSAETVLCIGHAPHLDLVLGRMAGAGGPVTELKKAGVALLEVDPRSGRGRLLWLLTPRLARRLA